MGTNSPIRIVADVYERQSGIPDTLEALGAEVEVAKLWAGDYRVGAYTLVERKRVLDLHAAIIKGRFWPQLGKLRATCSFPYLLVEGVDLDQGPLGPSAVRGACLAAIDQGIALIQSRDRADSARWLFRLAARTQRTEQASDRPAYAQRPKPSQAAVAEAMLSAVPGISASSARALLRRFGSMAEVFAASRDELLSVSGIGPERAAALEQALRAGSTLSNSRT